MTNLTSPVDQDVAAALRERIDGRVLLPGEAGWAEQVTGFNAAVTHAPALVVLAASPADVQAAVAVAAEAGLSIGVQATGHGATVPMDGGLLIHTGLLNAVSVDPDGTATVQAGARWREVIDAAAQHGLAPLNGSSSDVGAVGYTLGGGVPVLGRTFGFAADHVRSLEVVTADGQLRHVDAETEPDLFWGLRGGGGNLGVVVSMTVHLVPVASFHGGGIFYAAEHVATVLHAWREWCPSLPGTVTTSVAILRLPPDPEIPEFLRGQTVAHVRYCQIGSEADPAALLAPMRAAAPALADTIADMPYTAIDTVHMDPDHPVPFCSRGIALRELSAETVDALLCVAGPEQHVPLVACEIRQFGGALARPPAVANAVGGRTAAYSLSVIGIRTPQTAAIAPAVVDSVIAAAQPWADAHTLLNLHGTPGDEADRSRPWDPATYQRLTELAAHHDPQGRLRHGHTIARPAAV